MNRVAKYSCIFICVLALGILATPGCGGGGTTGTTGTTATSGGSGFYAAPIDLGPTTNSIVAALPTGQMVGTDNSGNGLYWSSPTASPQSLNGGRPTALAMVGGQVTIVGYVNSSPTQAAKWNTPGSAPTLLPMPATTASIAHSINSAGVIVGEIITSPSLNPVNNAAIWPDTLTSAYLLGSGGSGTFPNSAAAIFDDGSIVSDNGWVWASKTATPTAILPNHLSSSSLIASKSPTGFGQSFFPIPADISDSSIWIAYESGSTYNAVQLPNPSGDIYARMTGTSPNGWVFGDGQTNTGPEVGIDHGFVWKDSISAPILVESLIPNRNNWHINFVDFGFSSRSLIVQGTNPGVNGGATHYLLLNPIP